MTAAHDTQALAAMTAWGDCGMPCRPTDYHPMAACLMFKACHDSDQVTANLQAVHEHAHASRLQEQEGQPALSERTPKDYAIEHAEYMAVAAERLSEAVNLLAVAHRDEHDDPDIERAHEAVDEGLRAVRDRVYEFRKRRDRATLAAGSQAVQVPGWRPIETAPKERNAMFVARGFNVDSPRVGARNYTTDPYCVMPNGEGWWHRWPHTFPPTHWMEIPPLQPLAGGEVL